MKQSLAIILVATTCFFSISECYTPVSRGCDERSCYPATGNLLIGRQDKLSATSTCGMNRKERYCILSHLDATQSSQKCFWCDSTTEGLSSNPRTSHRVQNIVYRWEPPGEVQANQYRTWWQAENGVENVTIQLDLEAEFHVTHLIITYKTFRPSAMYIEKSYDWGNTWKVTRYFAADCEKSFPEIYEGGPRHLNETVCQNRYSKIVPSTMGTVIYRVLPPNINIHSPGFNPYSKEVQDLLKTTNLRIRMTKLHTLGDENIETDRLEIKEKYYYSIYDMTVRGSCSCYGHAEKCLPEKEEHKDINGMVHGKCDCTHNTMGNNCEYCLPDHNDLPWRPATGKAKNECKKCNCNDHATTCYFSPLVYAATGNLTGGVCENCTHFTEGRQCESCKTGYFHDPELPINHPEVCKQCDCEPDGTTDDGLCDQRTDEDEELVAGQCHCKTNVEGTRCDRCKNGYWNFTEENDDGCQICTCNLNGIVSNDGCDQESGSCTCKRFVEGRDCDQCMPNHYELSLADPNGCKPCDCDPGGSFDNNCDVETGQCKCRTNVGGRRCDEVLDGFFTGSLDYLLYEGETATGSTNPPATHIRREPSSVPGDTTWSGTGFMQVYEGSTLTFDIPGVFADLNYDLVIRYEHAQNFPNEWSNGKVELERTDGLPPQSEKCKSATTDPINFSLAPGSRYVVITPPLCLEEGQSYKVKLTFDQYDATNPDPKANILIDAIALVPNTESIPMFEKPEAVELKEIFEQKSCKQLLLSGQSSDQLPQECQDILKSLSMYAFEGGLDKGCECDNTGSESSLCDKYTGQCPCKKNVAGRKCDRCAVSHFGFGADGCQPCNCHSLGSMDPFCRQTDGQCACSDKAYGRRCNECQPGFWNFPNCQPCECNGHADTCDALTGDCHSCRDATNGAHCEVCLDGYYGDPKLETNIPCRECPCPNTKASGHSFAERCYLDTNNNEPVCECQDEYSGLRCSVCADNFYGNPEIPGGKCVACDCSNNWNFNDTGNCDANSGKCLKCLFNTEGDRCEICKSGYFGDAINEHCKECSCNLLGTDPEKFPCNRTTGHCNCLPNVEGEDCSRCIENHWRIALGKGCEPCECDKIGSLSESCNEFTGVCECKPGFGGRKCDQCEENYFGDPQVECFPCNCFPSGSQSFQCHPVTGECVCLEGIGGEKCDQCARGFIQEMDLSPDHPVHLRQIPNDDLPKCVPCGECFTNWERILTELRNETDQQIAKAEQVKVTGTTGAYSSVFEDMEAKLREIRVILDKASISNDELVEVQTKIDAVTKILSHTTANLDELDGDLASTKQSILQANSFLELLKTDADKVKQSAQDMKEKITKLQEANVEGALNLTREAKRRSDEAAVRVKTVQDNRGLLVDSEIQRRATETLMNNSRVPFSKTQEQNQETLRNIVAQIESLEVKIPELNKQVCDGVTSASQPCDELCGGAGCGKCGGLSCLSGALSKAESAVKSAESADKMLIEKDRKADHVLRDVDKVHKKAQAAAEEAQNAHDMAKEAQNRSMGETSRVNDLVKKIDNFSSGEKSKPEDVKKLAAECMAAELLLDPGQIENLASQINEAISGVVNVDQILEETNDDVKRAVDLKRHAEQVRVDAEKQLAHAERVTDALSKAEEAQNQAETAIQSTQTDIDSARSDLAQIETEMKSSMNEADLSVLDIQDLGVREKSLQTNFIMNQNHVNSAQKAAEDAKKQAGRANNELYKLNNGFKNVSTSLDVKTNSIGSAKDRAVDLQQRANSLATSASNKLANLRDIEKEFEENERRLMELSSELFTLNCEMQVHLQVIEDKSNYYRICSPPSTWTPSRTCKCDPGSQEPSCTQRRAVEEEF